MIQNKFPLSKVLGILVAQPLNEANEVALVRAAIVFWYSDVSLEREVVKFLGRDRSDLELRRAGYLLERFTRFFCASDERAKECLNVLRDVFPLHPTRTNMPARRRRVDNLALAWGLNEGLGLKVQAILAFQTRHVDVGSLDILDSSGD